MLISSMDGLLATTASTNVEKLLSRNLAKPSPIIPTNPTPQQFLRQNFQGQPTVLVSEAVGDPNDVK
jgi:hypothetical protein